MLVVVPSYQRLQLLRWSLISVIRAGRDVTGSKRLVLVSNHPPSNEATRDLLADIVGSEKDAQAWETVFVGRKQSMDPVDGWYGAIMDHAREEEVVFLHGDDDLIMPGGLACREAALNAIDAPLLISAHRGPLVFLGNESCFPPDLPSPPPPPSPVSLKFGDPMLGYAPFIGNLAYRFGPEFRKILETCSTECDLQSWLPRKERTLMLPYYLPMVALRDGMRVTGLDHSCVIRGNGYEELVRSPYQVPGWNNGFLYGITLDFLSTGKCLDCPGLEGDRQLYSALTAYGYYSVLEDSRIPSEIKREWIGRTRPRIGEFRGKRLRGLWPVVGKLTGLTRARLRASFGIRSAVPVRQGLLDRMFGDPPFGNS